MTIDNNLPLIRAAAKLHSFTILVPIVGFIGQINDSWAALMPGPWLNLHTLFGAVLWVWVIVRFFQRVRQAPRMQPTDIQVFARHLSRLVYLLLYGLMLCSLVIGLVHAPAHSEIFESCGNFQCYLAYGFIALITIRVLALLCHHFVMRPVHEPLDIV